MRIWCQTLKCLRVPALAGCVPGTPEERDTRRMGLLGCVSAGRPTKTRQIQTDTQTHMQTFTFFDAHTHRPSRSESCQLSDVLSSDYKPPVFLSSPCKLLSSFPPSLSLTPSLLLTNWCSKKAFQTFHFGCGNMNSFYWLKRAMFCKGYHNVPNVLPTSLKSNKSNVNGMTTQK